MSLPTYLLPFFWRRFFVRHVISTCIFLLLCDSGYSCVYTSNMSWRSATSPVAKEINPQAVFDRLFGSGEKFDEARSRQRRARDRKSVLDFALDDAQRLRRRLLWRRSYPSRCRSLRRWQRGANRWLPRQLRRGLLRRWSCSSGR